MKAGAALGSSSLGVGLFGVACTKVGCDGSLITSAGSCTMFSGWESIIIGSVGTIGALMVGDCAGSVASGGEACDSGVKFPAMSARRYSMAASSLGAAGFVPSIAVAKFWVALTIWSAGEIDGIGRA